MKNSLRRIFALLLAVMMIASLGMSAFAAETTATTPVTTKDYIVTAFKTLTKEDKAHAPDVDFVFTIAPQPGAPAAGVKFVANDTNQSVDANGKLTISVTPDASDIDTDTANAENSLTYDAKFEINLMNGTEKTFTDPGIYSYTITEVANNDNGITNDTTTTLKLDVYIGTMDDGALTIEGAMIYKGAEKLKGFVNDYDTADLTVTKNVTGNLGDRDMDFTFTLVIDGDANAMYYIEVSGETPKSITADANGDVTTTIYLKDNESFKVYGLSVNDTYTVTETAVEGYTTTITKGTTKVDAASEKLEVVADAEYTFTNDKSATVPTGIAMTVLPFVAMLAMAAVVAILFFRKKERREA